MRAPSPTVIAPRTDAFVPTTTLLPSVGWRLPRAEARSAQRHVLVERYVVADFGRFADQHAHAVIDEEALADSSRRDGSRCRSACARCSRGSAATAECRARHKRCNEAVRGDRVETGIRQQHVEVAARRGILFDRHAPVGAVPSANRLTRGGVPSIVCKRHAARPVANRFESAPVQDVRVDRSDAHHDAVVPEQREEQFERRPVALGRSTPCVPPTAHRRGAMPNSRAISRRSCVERQIAQFGLSVDVLADGVEKEQDLTIAQPLEIERRNGHGFSAQARVRPAARRRPSATSAPYAARNVSIQRSAAGGAGIFQHPVRCIACANASRAAGDVGASRAQRRGEWEGGRVDVRHERAAEQECDGVRGDARAVAGIPHALARFRCNTDRVAFDAQRRGDATRRPRPDAARAAAPARRRSPSTLPSS